MRLTRTEQIAAASVLGGGTGASQAIQVRIADAGTNDQMHFLDASGTSRLNLASTAVDLKLGGNYVTSTTDFNATMSQSGSSITITLGSMFGGARVTAAAATMTRVPSAAAKDATNHAGSTALVTEPGGADVDF